MEEEDERNRSFFSWLQKEGFDPSGVEIRRTAETGRCVVAKEDLTEEHLLFKVHRSRLLAPANSAILEVLQENGVDVTSWDALVLTILFEIGKKEESLWYPYLSALNMTIVKSDGAATSGKEDGKERDAKRQRREQNAVDSVPLDVSFLPPSVRPSFDPLLGYRNVPLFWSEEERRWLKESGVEERIGDEEVKKSFEDCVWPFVQDNEELFGGLTEEWRTVDDCDDGRQGDRKESLTKKAIWFDAFQQVSSLIMSYSFVLNEDERESEDEGGEEAAEGEETAAIDAEEEEVDGEEDEESDDYDDEEDNDEVEELEHKEQESEGEELDGDAEEGDEASAPSQKGAVPIGICMVPFADFLNHRSGMNNARLFASSEVPAELKREGFVMCMKTICPVKKGSELFNTYGDLPNFELLRKYGFVDGHYIVGAGGAGDKSKEQLRVTDYNPCDALEADLGLLLEIVASERKGKGEKKEKMAKRQKIGKKLAFFDDLDLLSDDTVLCFGGSTSSGTMDRGSSRGENFVHVDFSRGNEANASAIVHELAVVNAALLAEGKDFVSAKKNLRKALAERKIALIPSEFRFRALLLCEKVLERIGQKLTVVCPFLAASKKKRRKEKEKEKEKKEKEENMSFAAAVAALEGNTLDCWRSVTATATSLRNDFSAGRLRELRHDCRRFSAVRLWAGQIGLAFSAYQLAKALRKTFENA